LYSLDLDKWINAPPSDSSDEEASSTSIFAPSTDRSSGYNMSRSSSSTSSSHGYDIGFITFSHGV